PPALGRFLCGGGGEKDRLARGVPTRFLKKNEREPSALTAWQVGQQPVPQFSGRLARPGRRFGGESTNPV
ncbi:hypothetical protein Q604_UNBC04991G0001, partial [human gut metagenome]